MSATQDFKTNFCFPVRVLANDKIKLVPFDVSGHSACDGLRR